MLENITETDKKGIDGIDFEVANEYGDNMSFKPTPAKEGNQKVIGKQSSIYRKMNRELMNKTSGKKAGHETMVPNSSNQSYVMRMYNRDTQQKHSLVGA